MSSSQADEARRLAAPYQGVHPIHVFRVTPEQRNARNALYSFPIEDLLADFLTFDPQTENYQRTVTALCLIGNWLAYSRLRRGYAEWKIPSIKKKDLLNILRNMQHSATVPNRPEGTSGDAINRRTYPGRADNSFPIIDACLNRDPQAGQGVMGDVAVSDGTSTLEWVQHMRDRNVKIIGYDRMLYFFVFPIRPGLTEIFDAHGHLLQRIQGDQTQNQSQVTPREQHESEHQFREVDKQALEKVSVLNPEAEQFAHDFPDRLEFRTHDIFTPSDQRHRFLRVLGLLMRGKFSYFTDDKIKAALQGLGRSLEAGGHLMNGSYWVGGGQYDLYRKQDHTLVLESSEGYPDSKDWEVL